MTHKDVDKKKPQLFVVAKLYVTLFICGKVIIWDLDSISSMIQTQIFLRESLRRTKDLMNTNGRMVSCGKE